MTAVTTFITLAGHTSKQNLQRICGEGMAMKPLAKAGGDQW
jgi:hypothetical protein